MSISFNNKYSDVNFEDPYRSEPTSSAPLNDIQSNVSTSRDVKSFTAIDISQDVKKTIKKIKAENKKISPKKINENKINYITTASVLSIVSGFVFATAGVIFLLSGAGAPLGLGLLLAGLGLFALGCGSLKLFSKKISKLDDVQKNNAKIDSLKYLNGGIKGHDHEKFKNYLLELKQDLNLDNLSIPEFFVKYQETLHLYRLFILKEEEKNVRRYDSLFLRDYPCTTNYALAMVRFVNKQLEEALSKKQDIDLLLKVRKKIVKELPPIHETMSIDSIEKIALIEKEASKKYP